MSLTPNNRVRHSKMLNALMNLNAANNTGKTLKLRTWRWGKLGGRLGGKRSADGVVIDLPDGKSRNGSNVVAKFIFAESAANLNRAKQEYVIGNMMSKAGVGPKVYDYYEMVIGSNVNLENLLKKASGSNSVNLFQGNVNASRFKHCIVIIMENLYNGPGVVDAYTVAEGYKAQKPIPFDKIRAIIDKMHKLGVIHADMHQNNIMIQQIKTRTGYKYRPLIIDFGRSLKTNKSFKTNANANAYAKLGRTKSELWWWSNQNNILPVLLNGNGWKLTSQYNTRIKKPSIVNRIAGKLSTKINYIEKLNTIDRVNFIRYYWSNRSANNQTKPGLIKNIIFELSMVTYLLSDKNSGFTLNQAAPFINKIRNVIVGATEIDYYKLYKALNKLSVSQLQNIKASVPDMNN